MAVKTRKSIKPQISKKGENFSNIPCTNANQMLTRFFVCNNTEKLQGLTKSVNKKNSRKNVTYIYNQNEISFNVTYNDKNKTTDTLKIHINFSDYFSQDSNNSFKNFSKLFNFVFGKIFVNTVFYDDEEKCYKFKTNKLEFAYSDLIELQMFKTKRQVINQLYLFLSKFQTFEYSNKGNIGKIAFITNFNISTETGLCTIDLYTRPGEILPPKEFILLFFNGYMCIPNEYFSLDIHTASLLYDIYYKGKINEYHNREELFLSFIEILEQTYNLKIDIKNWREKLMFPLKESVEKINKIDSDLSLELNKDIINSKKSDLLQNGKVIIKNK